jgi:hypothetical protein
MMMIMMMMMVDDGRKMMDEDRGCDVEKADEACHYLSPPLKSLRERSLRETGRWMTRGDS